jgi:tRNA (guanine37-N1)-methyltransferase
MWQVNVFTIFPDAFPGNLGVSILKKAIHQKKWSLKLIDLTQFPVRSDRIDAAPYGGGAGMILSPHTFERAFAALSENEKKWRKIYFSPRGRRINQADFHEISSTPGVTMLCGRYEGVDQRIIDFYKMEEISVGDFVLLGGEIAAMMVIEGCVRLLPGVLGNDNSVEEDSFQDHLLEYDHYTRPPVFKGLAVPKTLLSGNHQKISEFRLRRSKEITMKKRHDLWVKYVEKKIKS